MVRISPMLAAVLSYSSFLSVSASPVAATEQDITLGGRDVVPTNWRGYLEAGKPMVYLSGSSFEDIEAKAKALNPAYSIYTEYNATEHAHELNSRAVKSMHCNWPPSKVQCTTGVIERGIYYLRNLKGDCSAPAGPGGCSRVSCSWDSAIWFCNDNRNRIWEPCRWIADKAVQLTDRCSSQGLVKGQLFVDRNWNVVIGKEYC